MSLTLELPPPLERELTGDAKREGVAPSEHVTLLLHLATALVSEGEPTPFRSAVRAYLAHRAVDAEQVSAVLEELMSLCLTEVHAQWAEADAFRQLLAEHTVGLDPQSRDVLLPLVAWREEGVHEPGPPDRAAATTQPSKDGPEHRTGGSGRAYGKYAGLIPCSEELIREKAEELAREEPPEG